MKSALILSILFVTILLASCSAPVVKPKSENNGALSVLVENSTSVSIPVRPAAPDKVELIYFHKQSPCHCMAVVGDNIQYAVDTYFKEETVSGRLKLTMIVSDDPANSELVKKYDAMLFTLLIREVRGGEERIYPVAEIWEMTGDDNRDKLVEFIRTTVRNTLEGKAH